MTHMSALAARHPLLSLYPDLTGGTGHAHPQPTGPINQFSPGGVTAPITSLSGALSGVVGKAAPWYATAPWTFPHLAALTSATRNKELGESRL